MSEGKPNWSDRVWSAAIVILGLMFIGLMVVSVLDFLLGGDVLNWTMSLCAEIAVVATAIGVWVEYVRKRRKARGRLPRLLDLQSDLATLRGRVARLEGREAS